MTLIQTHAPKAIDSPKGHNFVSSFGSSGHASDDSECPSTLENVEGSSSSDRAGVERSRQSHGRTSRREWFARALGTALAPITQGTITQATTALTAAAGLSALSALGTTAAYAGPPTSSIGDPDPASLITKLIGRITFGINSYELNLARAIGYDAYLDVQLTPEIIDDSACTARLAHLVNLNKIYAEIYQLGLTAITNELIEGALLRAIYSRRQLQERVVEFWTDHFNISVEKENCGWLKVIDDRDVIRANALGNFSDLLAASATSSAMLVYLDNHISIAGNPNLNYARELMELHTIGVDGGYTEDDVINVARCFTGWQSYPNNYSYPLAGSFRYNGSQHDNGAKRVLGHDIPAGGGIQDGLTVLNILAEHPSTAKFIATKLCKRFLTYSPSQSLIRTIAEKFTATNGNIREVLRTVFAAAHVQAAPLKFKRPFHHFVSAVRAVNAEVVSTSAFRTQLRATGHLTFYWVSPDGYPDSLEFWSGLVLPRWNFGGQLMNNSYSGITTDAAGFFAGLTTADPMVDRINSLMFGGEMETSDRNRVRDYLLSSPTTVARQRESLGLAIGSPSFQWY